MQLPLVYISIDNIIKGLKENLTSIDLYTENIEKLK